MTYVLSPQAARSLQTIRDYTLDNHGERQALVSLEMLREQMRKAAANPEGAGRKRDDVRAGYYAIRAAKHHIYYRIRDGHIEIIDVLHQRMLPANHIYRQSACAWTRA
jgi:toxin ParE1/3/4